MRSTSPTSSYRSDSSSTWHGNAPRPGSGGSSSSRPASPRSARKVRSWSASCSRSCATRGCGWWAPTAWVCSTPFLRCSSTGRSPRCTPRPATWRCRANQALWGLPFSTSPTAATSGSPSSSRWETRRMSVATTCCWHGRTTRRPMSSPCTSSHSAIPSDSPVWHAGSVVASRSSRSSREGARRAAGRLLLTPAPWHRRTWRCRPCSVRRE